MSQSRNTIKPSIISAIASLLICLAPLGFSTSTIADVVSVPVSKQDQAQQQKPRHGLSMLEVEQNYGQPLARADAVGEPPITRWQYADFTVYFEHDIVIHAVTHVSNSN